MKFLFSFWAAWKKLAHRIGIFQSKVMLTVFYFLLTPFGLFFTLFKDELQMKSIPASTWKKFKGNSDDLENLKQQF